MNKLSESLNIKYPVFNAGMAFVAGPELASQVTLNGGLGFIGAGVYPPEIVTNMFSHAKKLCQQGPIGIDFVTPFFQAEHLHCILSIKPEVVAFFYGIPCSETIADIRGIGTQVWAIVNTLDEAKAAVSAKVDALVLQGKHAGGHNRSQRTTAALLSEIGEVFPYVPLIAAGGIVDGIDVNNMFKLNASGVWCGTVFLASDEANAHQDYKQTVLKCGMDDTKISHAFGPEWPDEPSRVYRNSAVKAADGLIEHIDVQTIGTSYFGSQAIPMPKYSVVLPMKDTEGDTDWMGLTMGTEASRISELRSVRDIMSELVSRL